MFAPNCVGTANATAAGWGNLGGGVTQFVMPILAALLAGTLGLGESLGWRVAMVIAGSLCLVMGVAYYFLTQDCPAGNFADLRSQGQLSASKSRSSFWNAARDYRVWALALAYAACFGVELTMDNVAHTYFVDNFDLSIKAAGFAAGAFGLMNIFARALGGYIADWFGLKWRMQGRVSWLFIALFCEGLALVLFSQMRRVELAIPAMLLAGLFVKMSNGATYAIVPFIGQKSLGSAAGIVGAGGNIGAVLMAFFLGGNAEAWPACFLMLGFAIVLSSFFVLVLQRSGAGDVDALPTGVPLAGTAPMPLPEPAAGP
jgi:NNP family nitrate/nitrite transporter-like MFS transporter